VLCCVVDRHRFDAGTDPECFPNDADTNADPFPSFKHVVKQGKLFLLLFTAMPVYNVFPFSSVANVS
jgi:hypothetical protein